MYSDCLHNGQFLGIKSNNIVLYTEDECNKLNGNYGGSGECLKKMGGSYSYECMNYTPSNLTPTYTNIPPTEIPEPLPMNYQTYIPPPSSNDNNSFGAKTLFGLLLCSILSLFIIIPYFIITHDKIPSSIRASILIPLSIPCVIYSFGTVNFFYQIGYSNGILYDISNLICPFILYFTICYYAITL